ncbi:MAG: InlB B-repeat-containing protein, partial [Ruminiclostridium sp.]|nr:InlB B-repeat-containing protein [Ruminiclostridium sp.]
MKKKFALMTALSLVACVVLCSCDNTKYTVQLDMNYSGSETTSVTTGSKLSAEEPKREGYNFIGWFKDKNLAQKWDNGKDKVTEGLTLYAGWDKDTGDEIQNPSNDKDFTKLHTPGKQEDAYDYSTFFLPEKDEAGQGFVGDTMPYYEDGTFYIYYLKESGDSYNHSIYLTTTKDFVTYTEQQEVVLEASRSGG